MYFKGRKCLRKKLLWFGFAAKLFHFVGKNFRGSTKLEVFSGKTFAVDQNERYFSIFLDTLGAFNGMNFVL